MHAFTFIVFMKAFMCLTCHHKSVRMKQHSVPEEAKLTNSCVHEYKSGFIIHSTLSRCIAEFEIHQLEQICVKGKNPLISNREGITPTNTVLRAATRIVTTYGCSWGMGVAYHIALYSTKIHTVTAYFYHCHRVTSKHR